MKSSRVSWAVGYLSNISMKPSPRLASSRPKNRISSSVSRSVIIGEPSQSGWVDTGPHRWYEKPTAPRSMASWSRTAICSSSACVGRRSLASSTPPITQA